MTQSGGSAAINGFLYQMLNHLDWLAEVGLNGVLDGEDLKHGRLVLEPKYGGDAQAHGSNFYLVEQYKTRAERTWPLSDVTEVLRDLRRSVSVPVGLAHHLVDPVAFGPLRGDALDAGSAAVHEDDVVVLRLRLVEARDDGACVRDVLAARDGDQRSTMAVRCMLRSSVVGALRLLGQKWRAPAVPSPRSGRNEVEDPREAWVDGARTCDTLTPAARRA